MTLLTGYILGCDEISKGFSINGELSLQGDLQVKPPSQSISQLAFEQLHSGQPLAGESLVRIEMGKLDDLWFVDAACPQFG